MQRIYLKDYFDSYLNLDSPFSNWLAPGVFFPPHRFPHFTGSSDEIAKKIGGKGKGLGSQDKSLLAWANVMAALAENQHLSDKQQLEGHGSPKAANAKVRGMIRTGAEDDADRGTVN